MRRLSRSMSTKGTSSTSGGTSGGRRFTRLVPVPLGVNLTTMIDVTFLLLVYFMLVGKFATPEAAIPAGTPAGPGQAADPFELPERPVTVRVRSVGDAHGAYEISSDAPGLRRAERFGELAAAAAESIELFYDVDQRVIVAPESGTLWEHTLGAVHALRRGGFVQVGLAEPTS